MSYSSQTKEELCRFEPDSVCCLLAELSGIVCAAGSVIYRGGGEKRLSIETENNAVARRAFRLLREVFDVQPQLVTLKRSRLGGRSAYRIEISGSEASFVLEGCGIEMGQRRGVPREITVRKCCRMSFLRGVFLACGSVTDPEKEYHLEFVLEDEAFAAALQRLIARFSLSAHLTKRRAMTLVYLKGQNEITDMLSIFGAQSARFAMEDAYIRKELRNNANRAVNCDSANVQRAVTAASPWPKVFRRPRISMMGSLIESLLSIFAGHKKTPLTLALKHQGRSLLRGTTLLRPDLAVRTFPSADTLSRDHGRPRRSLCTFLCGRCATPRPCFLRPSVPVFTLRALFAVPPQVLFSSSSLLCCSVVERSIIQIPDFVNREF